MSISKTRERLERGLLDFAWNEWAQLGVFTSPVRISPWAQDLEALLVFSLDVARADPRLFDEILDWLVRNEELLSVRRLRTLARRGRDPSLVEGMLGWLATQRPKARFARVRGPATVQTPQRLFFDEGFPIRSPNEQFLEHGWLRPDVRPSGNARQPVLRDAISFGLRLRRLLGPGARAESVRVLLCTDAPTLTASVITRSAAFSKRNVLEALRELEEAEVVSAARVGHEARYAIYRERWAALLELRSPFPAHMEWVQLFGALGAILEWLRVGAPSEASDYLVGSAALGLLADIRPELAWAGIEVDAHLTARTALEELGGVVRRCLAVLGVGGSLDA